MSVPVFTPTATPRKRRPTATHYVGSVLFTLGALLFTAAMRGVFGTPVLFLFTIAITLSSWQGGLWPGLLSTTLSVLLADYFLFEPLNAFTLSTQNTILFLTFALVGVLISFLQEQRLRSEESLGEAHQQLQTVLHNMADGVTVQRPDSQPIFANQIAAQITGFSSVEALLATPIAELRKRYELADEDGQRLSLEDIPTARAMRGIASSGIIHMRFDGGKQERWVQVKSVPIFDAQRNVTMVVNLLSDVQEQIQANILRRRLSQILQNVPGIIWEATGSPADEGGQRITFISGYVEKMLGYTPEEAMAMDGFWQTIVAPDDWETTWKNADQVYANGGTGNLQFQLVARNGRIFTGEAHTMVVTDKAGKPTGACGVIMDVEDRLVAQSKLAEYTERLRQSNIELQQFAYIASHDLQEPLRMVSSFLGLLERRYSAKLDDTARQYIGFAVDGAQRMKHLIDDLLTYSRVDSQQRTFDLVLVDKAVEEAWLNLRQAVSESGATLHHDPLPDIWADRIQIVQLFQNLLSNAIKFRRDVPPEVWISASSERRFFVFRVRDNGIGIEAQYHEKIFNIFQRLHAREKYAGTGIGLAICKKIVERHGGKISVESIVGEGTTFVFTLPMEPGVEKTERPT